MSTDKTDKTPTPLHHCRECGNTILPVKRAELGYRTCLQCGDDIAVAERKAWCVAPMHKSNYMLITRMEDLSGLNNKGGIVR